MAKIKFTLAVIAATVGFSIFGMPLLAQRTAQGTSQTPPRQAKPASEKEPERKQMQFYADEQFNIEGTDTIIMLGNVVLHHNGAVVVCDSAVRYSESRFDCFGKVIINQDSTYIYCHKATYDRDENVAQVFDRLIKVVSGTSVLYTYNFSFNTLDSVGRYWGGGTMLQDSNRMESDRGWYHTGTNDIYAAGHVQMTDPDYKLISDSVRYNTGEQVAEFYTLTYIWNPDGEMMSAWKGKYYNRTREYDFTSAAYVITSTRELWADSLVYNSESKDAVARRNIQMLDDEQQMMAFGDYGEWHGGIQEGLLTRNPSVLGFDRETPEDTVYMRADSMFLYSIPWDWEWGVIPEDSSAVAGESVSDSIDAYSDLPYFNQEIPRPVVGIDTPLPDAGDGRERELSFSDSISSDSATLEIINRTDTIPVINETLEIELLLSDSVRLDSAVPEIQTDTINNIVGTLTDIVSDYDITRAADSEELLLENDEADSIAETRDSLTDGIFDLDSTRLSGVGDSLLSPVDSLSTLMPSDSISYEVISESLPNIGELPSDSIYAVDDSLALAGRDSLVIATDSVPREPEHDSLQRMMKAYRNVKIWRRDFQGVCDSMVAFTKDTTAHMYIEPVLWNGQNQITASVIDIYAKDEELYRAVFTGDPMMVAEVYGMKYNQIKGLRMESFFKNNEVRRHYVDGNAQTYYYKVEDGDLAPSTFAIINSATIMFWIENQDVTRITFDRNPDFITYPIDQIPDKVDQELPGFKWEAERRPVRSDVFTRTIKPSQRQSYMDIPQPQFPLTQKIEQHKRQLINHRLWEERYELLPQAAIEWLRKIGVGQ